MIISPYSPYSEWSDYTQSTTFSCGLPSGKNVEKLEHVSRGGTKRSNANHSWEKWLQEFVKFRQREDSFNYIRCYHSHACHLPLHLERNLSLLPSPYMIWSFLPLPPHLIPPALPISHSLHPLLPPLYSLIISRLFLFQSEFTFCSFCLKRFPLRFPHGWSFNFPISSDRVPSLCTPSLPVPFCNKSLLRLFLIHTVISNYLVYLFIFLLIVFLTNLWVWWGQGPY